AVVCTEGTDLLDQWGQTLLTWQFLHDRGIRIVRQYGTHHSGQSFALNPTDAVLIVSRSQLAPIIAQLAPEERNRVIIIHDEVHGLGAPECVRQLAGTHASFGYTLGLSATPERE